jgi:hypothetical protein
MIRRFVTGGAVSSALALTLTGCLGDTGRSGGQGAGGDAVKLSAAQVLAKTSQNTGRIDSFTADVAVDSGGTTSVKAAGTMRYRFKPTLAYSMTFDQMTVAGQSLAGMRQVFVDKTMYMKIPMLTQVAGAKPWLKISLAEVGRQSGVNLDQMLQQAQQLDPVQNTKLLTASKDAREVGKETVGGVQTTHYAGTYSMSDAVAKLDAQQRDAFQKVAGETGMGTMAFDVWVDGERLPRKMTMKTAQSAKTPMTITVTYRDFGKSVTITPPPASEIGDFSEVFKNLRNPAQPGTPSPTP